jgi:hypothetical protein
MSTAATPALAPELESYVRAWAKSMAAARQSMSAATCEVSAQAPSHAPAVAEGDIWIAATSSGELSGVVAFRWIEQGRADLRNPRQARKQRLSKNSAGRLRPPCSTACAAPHPPFRHICRADPTNSSKSILPTPISTTRRQLSGY